MSTGGDKHVVNVVTWSQFAWVTTWFSKRSLAEISTLLLRMWCNVSMLCNLKWVSVDWKACVYLIHASTPPSPICSRYFFCFLYYVTWLHMTVSWNNHKDHLYGCSPGDDGLFQKHGTLCLCLSEAWPFAFIGCKWLKKNRPFSDSYSWFRTHPASHTVQRAAGLVFDLVVFFPLDSREHKSLSCLCQRPDGAHTAHLPLWLF